MSPNDYCVVRTDDVVETIKLLREASERVMGYNLARDLVFAANALEDSLSESEDRLNKSLETQ